jgi:hypothetical protein
MRQRKTKDTNEIYYTRTRSKATKTPVRVCQTGPYYLSRLTHTKKGLPLKTRGSLIKLTDRHGRYIQWVNEQQAQMLVAQYPTEVFWLNSVV